MTDVTQQSTDPQALENDPRDVMRLPPLGEATKQENWGKVNGFLNQYAQKAVDFYTDPCDRADLNLQVLTTGKSTAVCEKDVIANKIRQDLYTLMAALMRDSVTRTVLPEETESPPVMVQFLDRQTMSFQQFPVDDQCKAEFEQKAIDWHWDHAQLDVDVWMALFNARTAGWYTSPYTFDWQTMLPKVWTNISVRQVLLDVVAGPLKAVETSNWSFLRHRINWWQARAMFPRMNRIMAQKATEGPERADPILQLGKNQQSQITGEKMADLTFFFHRNYPVIPMTPQEGIAYGLLEERPWAPQGQVPGEQQAMGGAGQGQAPQPLLASGEGQANAVSGLAPGDQQNNPFAQLDGSSNGPEPVPDNAGAGADQGAGQQPGGSESADPFQSALSGSDQPESGGVSGSLPDQSLAAHNQAPQTAYFLPDDDKPITDKDPEWPYWLGVRQIARVDQVIAEDRICTDWDMPFLHMPGNPQPLSACGQGDPEVREKLQEGHIRALSNAVEHSDLMAHPVKVMCESAYAAMDARYKEEGASIAGLTVIIDNDLYEKLGGKITVTEDSPPISTSLSDIIELLNSEGQDVSTAPNAVQGKQTGDITGWQTTQMLLQQATSKYDLPAMFLRLYVERLMHFVRHSVLWCVPVEKLQQICSEYPPEVVAYLVQEGRQSDRDIEIIVNPSSGGMQDRRKSEAVQQFGMIDETPGSPTFGQRAIGMQSLREAMGIDNKKETQRQQIQPQQPQQNVPSEAISFKDLTPSGQVQMAAQAGIRLDLAELQAKQDQEQQVAMQKAKSSGNGRMAQTGDANG